jgi:phosphatidylserine/phosphatidylglycerophosphate/cardiolipin synthase-like enzyme
MSPSQIGIVLDLLAKERARQQDDADRIQMVWTGPDQEGPAARDTGVVARELLGQASKSLLITTYSISRGSTTFEPVNDAMQEHPDLDVTLIIHVDMSRQSLYGTEAAAAFAREFWLTRWPWESRPRVFYDPRGVLQRPAGRALQHAKCIVIDVQRVFITSANYTESGQQRNVELGVVIRDERLAERVSQQFRSLIAKGLLMPLPGRNTK